MVLITAPSLFSCTHACFSFGQCASADSDHLSVVKVLIRGMQTPSLQRHVSWLLICRGRGQCSTGQDLFYVAVIVRLFGYYKVSCGWCLTFHNKAFVQFAHTSAPNTKKISLVDDSLTTILALPMMQIKK